MSDPNKMYEDWARFTIDRWQKKVNQLKVIDTGELLKSFQSHVSLSSAGDANKIVFTYKYYGIFSNMGVGKGVPFKAVANSNRRKKPWYSTVFFKEIYKLSDLMAERYGQQAISAIKIIENITEVKGI